MNIPPEVTVRGLEQRLTDLRARGSRRPRSERRLERRQFFLETPIGVFGGRRRCQELIPREVADRLGVKPYGTAQPDDPPPSKKTFTMFAQQGTPYAVDSWGFLSPLGSPCNQPPSGTLAVVDLETRETIWRRPLGTTRDVAPLGLPLSNLGGTVTTRGGVTFVGATIDDYLPAFDTETGRELWKGRLPAGGQANPISYVSGNTGRQYVVIAAGGHGSMRTTPGDYIVTFALPEA